MVGSSGYDDLFFTTLVDSYVGNPRFLRRDWLADEVMARLKEPTCRFLLLTAEPGAGKSVFVAQLAKDNPRWPVYFIRRDQSTPLGDAGARSFLVRLGFQLAAIYPELFTNEQLTMRVEQVIDDVDSGGEVVGAKAKRILTSPFCRKTIEISQRVTRNQGKTTGIQIDEVVADQWRLPIPDLQNMALIAPARELSKSQPAVRIVILVDALDELRYHATEDTILSWLTGCPELPANVRFVLTSRPPDDALLAFCEKQEPYLRSLAIASEDKRVQKDSETYVEWIVTKEEVMAVLEGTEKGVEGFARKAVARADGNIGYLDALARGIDQTSAQENLQALRELLTLQELPQETEDLYAFFLRQIRTSVSKQRVEVEDPESGEWYDKPAWPAVYKPILGVLTIALEPLNPVQIAKLSGIKAGFSYVTDAIDQLRQFMDLVDNSYRLYHATVPEFLMASRTQEQADTAAFYVNPVHWHRRIANYYWPERSTDWKGCDSYGFQHLAKHVAASGDAERLYALIDQGWMQARYRDAGYTYAGFVADLDLARQRAVRDEATDPAPLIRLETIRQLIRARVAAYSDVDLATLVHLGREEEALSHARLRDSPEMIFAGLMAVYSALPDEAESRPALLIEAEEITNAMVDDAPRLRHADSFAEAAEIAAVGSTSRTNALGRLAVALAAAGNPRAGVLLETARKAAFEMPTGTSPQRRSAERTLRALAASLTEAGRYETAEEVALSIDNPDLRSSALRELAAALLQADSGRADAVIALAEEAARAIEETPQSGPRRSWALRDIAGTLARAGRHEAARAIISSIEDAVSHAQALGASIVLLARAGQAGVVEELLDQALRAAPPPQASGLTRGREYGRGLRRSAAVLAELAVSLARAGDGRADELFAEAEHYVDVIRGGPDQTTAFERLETRLTRGGRYEAAKRLILTRIGEEKRPRMLSYLSSALARDGRFEDAYETAGTVDDRFWRSRALSHLAAQLARANDARAGEVLDEALQPASSAGEIAQTLSELVTALATAGNTGTAVELARSIEVGNVRALSLGIVADAVAGSGDERAGTLFDEALEAAGALAGEQQHGETLRDLVGTLASVQRFDQAEEVAGTIQWETHRGDALYALVMALAASGRFDTAHRLARDSEEAFWQAPTLADLAAEVAKVDDARAGDLFREARETAESIRPGGFERGYPMERVVAALTRAGRIDEAQEWGRTPDGGWYLDSPVHVVRALASAGRFQEARDMLQDDRHSKWGAARRELVIGLAEAGRFDEAESLARAIGMRGPRQEAFRGLAAAMAGRGEYEAARRLADGLDRSTRDKALCEIAKALALDGRFQEAEELARSIGFYKPRGEALHTLATALMQAGLFQDAREVARPIGAYPAHRQTVLRELGLALARESRFAEALRAIGERKPDEFLKILAEWTPHLEGVRPGLTIAVLREATGVLGWLLPEWQRVHALLSP